VDPGDLDEPHDPRPVAGERGKQLQHPLVGAARIARERPG
jgi:hypothetical protein